MSVRHFLAMSSAVMAGASAATAQDLYFGAYGSLASVEDIDVGNILSFNNGYAVGGVVGTNLTDMLRVEAELSYLNADLECDGKCSGIDFDLSTLSLLGNAWVDFDTGSDLTPYLGGGVGVARVSIDSDLADDDDTGFAYQIGFGARFGPSGEFDVGYRYRDVSVELDEYSGEEIEENDHLLQFRWTGRF